MKEYFERLGLPKYQSAALASLIGRKNATGMDISTASGIPITKIYSVLVSLEEMGLVESSLERPKRYNMKDIGHVVDFLIKKYDDKARMVRKVGKEITNITERSRLTQTN